MRPSASWLLLPVLLGAAAASAAQPPREVTDPDTVAFNRSFAAATRTMDNAATLALWEEDGVSLLPNAAPIVGKPAIAAFLAKVTANLHGAHMDLFELDCHDAIVAGHWASEWCNEHQVVSFARQGRLPFDGRGRVLLVLHHGGDGRWRIHEEMWQPINGAR